jgi:hypothetical protein
MPAKLDDLLPALVKAGDSGLSKAKIEENYAGKSKAKDRAATVLEKLATLVRAGAVSGPFPRGKSQYYFAAGRGPSIETASQTIVSLVQRSGIKLMSKAGLTKKVTGMNARFFADGLKHAVSSQAIVELSCGSSKYFLHRDVAADYFGFEAATAKPSPLRSSATDEISTAVPLTFESLLPIYRRLKAEQGGFSAVKIFDLMKAVNGSKDELHRLIIEETKAGRITIHPTTTADLPKEEMEAGIRLAGFPEPFVTVVIKNEP